MKSIIEKRNWRKEGDERVCQLTGIIVCSSILNSAMQIFTTPFTRSGILPRWWMFRGSVCLASFSTVLWILRSSVWIGSRKFDIFLFFFEERKLFVLRNSDIHNDHLLDCKSYSFIQFLDRKHCLLKQMVVVVLNLGSGEDLIITVFCYN